MKRALIWVCALLLTGCAARTEAPEPTATVKPAFTLTLPVNSEGVPLVKVFVTADSEVQEMELERYLCGVVAGEMRSDWPMEALRAQAILARTFVLKFVSEKSSRYDGADISTDIAEAQAYDAGAVDDRVREAVSSTAGLVLLTADGALPYAWFHAHSGGRTALAREGLDWRDEEPPYTRVTDGLDSAAAPPSAQAWSADFPKAVFLAACRDAGTTLETADEVVIEEKGESGRAITLSVDGHSVNAARLRLALGGTVMRSTLLTELSSDGATVHMAGLGYGHGVGMPQWGAYALAEDGWRGEDIALYYFSGVSLSWLW